MPFVSEAQRRKFHADPRLHKYIAEYDAATPKGKNAADAQEGQASRPDRPKFVKRHHRGGA
jgi:hypothetical protein